jgi:flagellar hook-basal body protein
MDRLVYTALNSLANLRDDKVVSAQNLANLSVPGFRRDLPNSGPARFLEALGAQTSRAFQLESGVHGMSRAPGPMEKTDDPMDIAIADRGFFVIEPASGGEPALSRRGDLQVSPDGTLRNGAGDLMLDADLQPITLPPFREMIWAKSISRRLMAHRGSATLWQCWARLTHPTIWLCANPPTAIFARSTAPRCLRPISWRVWSKGCARAAT